jgi:preprotein translocase subunit SecE
LPKKVGIVREGDMGKEKSENINKFAQLKLFLEDSKEELKKVVWPEKKVVVNATWVVIGITVVVAAVLGIIDLLYTNLIKFIVS